MTAWIDVDSPPLEPLFSWEVGPQRVVSPHRIQRGLDRQPARVLVSASARGAGSDAQSLSADRPGEPAGQEELDEAGAVVQAWVDSLTTGEMLAIARELAERRLDWGRMKVADLQQALGFAGRDVRQALLLVTALDVDDKSGRDQAIQLATTWDGDLSEFRRAIARHLP